MMLLRVKRIRFLCKAVNWLLKHWDVHFCAIFIHEMHLQTYN
uniref:Uncharacterized protein n=1 Tax=Rhizophora mucronata TaxID=61149 RepID=A0A2P2NR88_RHIMU